ncbi:hypothetical protein ES708_06598 [subsurface metagenome]
MSSGWSSDSQSSWRKSKLKSQSKLGAGYIAYGYSLSPTTPGLSTQGSPPNYQVFFLRLRGLSSVTLVTYVLGGKGSSQGEGLCHRISRPTGSGGPIFGGAGSRFRATSRISILRLLKRWPGRLQHRRPGGHTPFICRGGYPRPGLYLDSPLNISPLGEVPPLAIPAVLVVTFAGAPLRSPLIALRCRSFRRELQP